MLMNSNRRSSAVNGMLIEGAWVEDPIRVKEEICNFFMSRFSEPDLDRPEISGTRFRRIGS